MHIGDKGDDFLPRTQQQGRVGPCGQEVADRLQAIGVATTMTPLLLAGAEGDFVSLADVKSKELGKTVARHPNSGAIEGFADRAYLNTAGTALVNGGVVGLQTWSQVIQRLYHAGDPLASLYNREPQVTDPGVFDFFHHSLTGPIKYEWAKWSSYSGSIEQTFLNGDAGIELAFDKETLDNGYTAPLDYRINLDVNEVLPNGNPNPNFLRPMTAGSDR